jgi:hypothetical protein
VGLLERQKPKPTLGNHCTRERRISEVKSVFRVFLNYFLVFVDACKGYNHKCVLFLVRVVR